MEVENRSPFALLQHGALTRRRLLRGTLGLGFAGLLAACGGEESGNEDASPDPTGTATTDSRSTQPSVKTSGASADTREFEHALGVATIPADPQRVAILNIIALDAALLTGVTPVAAVLGRETPWRTDIAAIETTLGYEVDVEQLVAAEPDLILDGASDGALFSAIEPAVLSDIAPVVAYDFTNDHEWPEYFLYLADALNRRAEAEQVLARYDERIDELQQQLGDTPPRVALLRVMLDGIRNYTQTGFVARIFDDLAIPAWDYVEWDFSLERVNEIDAEVIFLYGSENDPAALEAELERIRTSPIWQSHPTIQAGNVHVVGSHWFGFGPTEAMLVLDDLARTLELDQTSDTDAETRLWKGDASEALIPINPQRIVSLDSVGTDLIVTLGAQDLVVGYVETNAGIDAFGFPDDWVYLGNESEFDIELIATLQPDLILGLDWDLDLYNTLSQIAPVAAIPWHGGFGWREYWRDLGVVLNLSEEVDAFIAEIDRRIADLSDQIPDGTSLSLMRVGANGLGIYPGFYPADLINALGLETPPDQAMGSDEDPCCVDVSLERLREHDADVIFIAVGGNDEAREQLDAITANPIWEQLDAYQRDRIYTVSAANWIQWGPSSVQGALDDVERFIVGR